MTGLSQPATARAPLFPSAGCALIIGGTGGLGAGVVRTFADNGVPEAITYRSNSKAADALVAEVSALGVRARAFAVDLVDPASVRAAVEGAVAEFGGIHSVIHAAGAPLYLRYLSKIEADKMAYHVSSDIMGLFHVLQETLPHVRAVGGSYVVCGSCGVEKWPIKDALSVVPKAGMLALVKGVAREEGRFGVRANMIGTGVINAGIAIAGVESGDVPTSFLTGAAETTPLGRLGDADDIAEAALYFASSRAKFVTGQLLNVDGGWSV